MRTVPRRFVGLPVNRFGTAERQCTEKFLFFRRKDARRAAKALAERTGRAYREYRCSICLRGFHVATDHLATKQEAARAS